jgi:hypothetical protein
VKKQRTVIPSTSLEVSEPVASKPAHTRSEIPEEELPILVGADRILWSRMGGAVLACVLLCIAALAFEACL